MCSAQAKVSNKARILLALGIIKARLGGMGIPSWAGLPVRNDEYKWVREKSNGSWDLLCDGCVQGWVPSQHAALNWLATEWH